MEQSHPVSDALPDLTGPGSLPATSLKSYRWAGWSVPRYNLRLKDSYAILRKAMPSLTAPPSRTERPAANAEIAAVRQSPQAGSLTMTDQKASLLTQLRRPVIFIPGILLLLVLTGGLAI